MNRRKFRDLLLVYLAVAILGSAYGLYVGVTAGRSAGNLVANTEFDQNLQKEISEFHRTVSDRQSRISIITSMTMLLVIIAWIGLFLFWKPARILFCAYLVFAYLIRPWLGSGLEGLQVDSALYGFYCSIFMERPNAIATILATLNIAFDTIIVIAIYSSAGTELFKKVETETYT